VDRGGDDQIIGAAAMLVEAREESVRTVLGRIVRLRAEGGIMTTADDIDAAILEPWEVGERY